MFTLVCGPMFSGKTAELIRLARRDQIGGRRVQVFKFAGDMRYASADQMASLAGTQLAAVPVQTARDIFTRRDTDADVIIIDEIQFFDSEIIHLIRGLVHGGCDVRAAGLTLDFKGEPFALADESSSMAEVMVYADEVIKLHAVCTYTHEQRVCGKPASRTQRLIDGRPAEYHAPLKVLGSRDLYEARCLSHHTVLGRPAMMRCVAQGELELA